MSSSCSNSSLVERNGSSPLASPSIFFPAARKLSAIIVLFALISEADVVKRLIDKGTETEKALGDAVSELERKTDFLLRLEDVEIDLARMKLPALSAALAPEFKKARLAFIDGDQAQAQQIFDAIIHDLKEEAKKPRPLAPDERGDVVAGIVAATATMAPVTTGLPVGSSRDAFAHFARAIAFLSGDPSVGTEVRFWIIRPVLALMLLVALCGIGVYTLYIKAPTFGASGLYDYLGLFVWGLGAEVAQRTLTTFQLPAR